MSTVSRMFGKLHKGLTPAKPVLQALQGPPAKIPSELRAVRNKADPWSAASHAANNTFRILSLDGGGVRGVMTLVVLARIAREYPAFLDRHVDLIAGTSTGGLIGLLLAAGYSVEECLDIYKVWIPRIFQRDYRDYLRFIPIENAKYNSNAKLDACAKYFGDRTLSDLYKHVMITAFNLKAASGSHSGLNGAHWHPETFSNLPRANGRLDPHSTTLAADAAMRTSAAPTFFPVYQGYVDGAVFASNPSLMAVARVFEHYPYLNRQNLAVLSLGCGGKNYSIETTAQEDDWGYRTWGRHLPGLMLHSQSNATENMLTMMLGKQYCRFDLSLQEDIAIDDYKAIGELIRVAEDVDVGPVMSFIRSQFGVVPVARASTPTSTAVSTSAQPQPHSQRQTARSEEVSVNPTERRRRRSSRSEVAARVLHNLENTFRPFVA